MSFLPVYPLSATAFVIGRVFLAVNFLVNIGLNYINSLNEMEQIVVAYLNEK